MSLLCSRCTVLLQRLISRDDFWGAELARQKNDECLSPGHPHRPVCSNVSASEPVESSSGSGTYTIEKGIIVSVSATIIIHFDRVSQLIALAGGLQEEEELCSVVGGKCHDCTELLLEQTTSIALE